MPRADRGARSDTRQRRAFQSLRLFPVFTARQVSDYSAGYNQFVPVDPSGGAVTVTLPPAADHRDALVGVKNVSASSNTITVVPTGDEQIESGVSFAFSTARRSVVFASDGTGWLAVWDYEPSGTDTIDTTGDGLWWFDDEDNSDHAAGMWD